MSFKDYRQQVFSFSIFKLEKEMYENERKIFVLSAFPEFLFDYFNADFWNTHAIRKNGWIDRCKMVRLN